MKVYKILLATILLGLSVNALAIDCTKAIGNEFCKSTGQTDTWNALPAGWDEIAPAIPEPKIKAEMVNKLPKLTDAKVLTHLAAKPKQFAMLKAIEEKRKLPAGMLRSFWLVESLAGDANITNGNNCSGHFQFAPATAKEFGLKNPFDLNQAANATVRLIRAYSKRAGRDNPDVADAYGMHQQGVEGFNSIMNATETGKLPWKIRKNILNNIPTTVSNELGKKSLHLASSKVLAEVWRDTWKSEVDRINAIVTKDD